MLFSGILIIGFVGYSVYENYNLNNTSDITIYKLGRKHILVFRYGREAVLIGDSSLLNNQSKMQFHVNHDLWAKNVIKVSHEYLNQNRLNNIISIDSVLTSEIIE